MKIIWEHFIGGVKWTLTTKNSILQIILLNH